MEWVKKFVLGCLNRSINGTIYFGVQDSPHGRITGINIPKGRFHWYQDLIDHNFTVLGAIQFKGISDSQIKEMKDAVSMCLKPIHFVPVRPGDSDGSGNGGDIFTS